MGVHIGRVLVAVIALQWTAQAMSAGESSASAQEYRYHRDYVLGTSMDLIVLAVDEPRAQEVERRVVAEVDRLSRILSSYEPNSEINRLNRSGRSIRCSPELIEVLVACENWRIRSGGAFNAQVAQMIAVWKQAEKTGEPPSAAAFCSLARQIDGRGWEVEPASGTARRVSQGAVTVDALAKGYIVDKAVAAASGRIDGVRGMMLDIGGDIAVWGTASAAKDDAPWQVGVADPRHPQDNAPSLAVLSLRNRAVATSGNYARYFEVASKRYSHIVDARTGWPADDVISATVAAADCMTADALATVLSVLPPAKGLELIGSLREERAEVECLIIDRSGKAWPSVGWQAALVPQPVLLQAAPEGAWEHELGISFSIANPGGRKYRRPFVAIWIEDADGKPVRTLVVWGKEAKYLKDLRSWWAFARNDRKLVQAVTRASRAPGRYQLVWDGNNDKGQPLPQGTYTVRVESAREKGQHVNMNGRIACMDKAATARIEGNSEIGEVSLSYGVREKKP